jgi:hypothetical protein
VDEILKPQGSVKSVVRAGIIKKGGAEATLGKRYSKSKKTVKARKEMKDVWAEDAESGEKAPVSKMESLVPQAMSYRPDPADQLRILQAIEKREQEKLDRMEKYKQDAEVIKKGLGTPDMASPYLLPFAAAECVEESEAGESFDEKPTKFNVIISRKEKEERKAAEKRRQEKKVDKQFEQIEAIAKRVRKEANLPVGRKPVRKALTRIDADQVILPEQVPGSLRDVSIAGNLVSDLYRSIKKRVAIGERKKRTNTLALKAYTLHCHK